MNKNRKVEKIIWASFVILSICHILFFYYSTLMLGYVFLVFYGFVVSIFIERVIYFGKISSAFKKDAIKVPTEFLNFLTEKQLFYKKLNQHLWIFPCVGIICFSQFIIWLIPYCQILSEIASDPHPDSSFYVLFAEAFGKEPLELFFSFWLSGTLGSLIIYVVFSWWKEYLMQKYEQKYIEVALKFKKNDDEIQIRS